MQQFTPRSIDFTYKIAPYILIEANELGVSASHDAVDSTSLINKIISQTIDKILQQSANSSPGSIQPIVAFTAEDASGNSAGNLCVDPNYKIALPLKPYPPAPVSIVEIEVSYYTGNARFDISAWDANRLRYSNSDHDDPRLLKEVLARIATDYKAETQALTLMAINGEIKLMH